MKKMSNAASPAVFALLLLSLQAPAAGGDAKSSRAASADAAPVLADLPQPEVRTSKNGTLKTTFELKITPQSVFDPVSNSQKHFSALTYEGAFPGPTLRMKPGDQLNMKLVNNLPPNPEQVRIGAFPHDRFTTNLHTHGLIVSPLGHGDNVLRLMEPGTYNPIQIKIPVNHPSGTFWYHPHKHGSTTSQTFGGLAGAIIIEGGPGTLDALPEVKNAKEATMVFQVIRTDNSDPGEVPFVYTPAKQFGSTPIIPLPPFPRPVAGDGLWAYLTGCAGTGPCLPKTPAYTTTNGIANPTITMRPGEVQRWRLVAAGAGEVFVVTLQGHAFNIVANDGITIPNMRTLAPGGTASNTGPGQPNAALVMASGQRFDVLVKAGAPGTYLLQSNLPAAIFPQPCFPAAGGGPCTYSVISGSGIAPGARDAKISTDTPFPQYPASLATLIVAGDPVDMPLPAGPLPVPAILPSIEKMLTTTPDVVRRVVFEECGINGALTNPANRMPSCGWYFERYGTEYWGGSEFNSLLMFRDADDVGVPNPDPDPAKVLKMPRIDYKKGALFDATTPLFDDMIVGNYEEWTVSNATFSDHSFHIHENPILVTHVNGIPLPVPEWHDTIIVPLAVPGPPTPMNQAVPGTVTFRTYFQSNTVGAFVMHCHLLQHEDVGMMQRLDIQPRKSRNDM